MPALRLLAWNIRQGGGARLAAIAEAVARHDSDAVVISEYRGGDSAARLRAALIAIGYPYATETAPPPGRNGVLIASRRPLDDDGPVTGAVPEPYRMVRAYFGTLAVYGVYMPNLLAKVPYWQALVGALAAESLSASALAIGDFNTCVPMSTRRARSMRRRIFSTRSRRSAFATCGGGGIPTAASFPGTARAATAFASTTRSCRRPWPDAPGQSAIRTTSG